MAGDLAGITDLTRAVNGGLQYLLYNTSFPKINTNLTCTTTSLLFSINLHQLKSDHISTEKCSTFHSNLAGQLVTIFFLNMHTLINIYTCIFTELVL